jgi:hypothetical protein
MFDAWKFIDWLSQIKKAEYGVGELERLERNKKICLDRVSGREYKWIAEEHWLSVKRCRQIFLYYCDYFRYSDRAWEYGGTLKMIEEIIS